jgi:hypothetical protein
MGEPQKNKGAFALTGGLLDFWLLEGNQAGLFRVDRQLITGKPLGLEFHHPSRVFFSFETDDKIIRESA